ncbi:YciI family protein [Luteipulveratus sp. YIM 133132]|uniref:YciI family protein n=1 Tax=Luteipulveratus flavus TaxID=3031728 RepID=A0ABT6C5V2_9MICO|nr:MULTISPECIES: YciI family protein [unclassified Luteipulveratus]MDE9366464.1 YciI family protein [Luteipulveratus sp. YIM 133132]MDF8264262.1 YciI family protein [Luteipulveratus sp. YIM 133296]
MDFDRYTVVLLVTPDDPPRLSEFEADRLQDAHLSHLADLHDRGVLLAAGPLDDQSGSRHFRGLSILRCEREEALRLKGEDPAVRAGVFELVAMPWMLPAGAVHFTPTTFPRSTRDV